MRSQKDVMDMKIAEARQLYSGQINAYNEQHLALSKQKQELEKKMNAVEDGKVIYANEAATLELTMQAVEEKKSEYQEYMDKLMEQWVGMSNMVSAQQQGEAMAEYAEDLGKIMEVARRLMKGGIVPAADEKKLMDYSMEMYQAAKNMGAMARQKDREEYDSLWEEDEEDAACEDATEVADNSEAFSAGPEIVEVADTVASVTVPE